MRVSTMFKLFYGILLSSVLTFAAVGVPWVDPDDVNADPPAVQTSGAVVLNRWTNQYADALAVSKTLGRPVLLAIATSKRTCTECKKWYKAMENPAWAKWLARHPMVLVFINYMSDRALYDEYHSLFKGEPSDTWPTLAILESGSSPTSPTILAKLDDEPDKKSIYPNCAKFTEWLGEYVYGYESTTVAFGDPPAAVVHEGETITGTLCRTGSDFGAVRATVRVKVDGKDSEIPAQTVIWEDGASGDAPFTFALPATDAYEAPRQLQFLLTATNLTDATMSVVTNSVSFSVTNGIESVETNDLLRLVTTNYNVTVTNRMEITTNYNAKSSIALNYGRQSFTMTFFDQLEWQTLAEFKSGNNGLASLSPDAGTPWFAGKDGRLRTPPIGAGKDVSLTWQAPAPGYLRYHLHERDSDAVTVTNTLSFRTGTDDWTVFANGDVDPEPRCIALAEGDKLRFTFGTTVSNTVLEFAELAFVPFSNAATLAKVPSDDVPYDAFAEDSSLLDLSWNEPASAGDARQHSISNRLFYTSVFSGNSVSGVVELGTAVATNACDAGMIAPVEAYAHGTLACRLDWLVDLSLFDFKTRDEIWVPGLTRTFIVSTKPAFANGVPEENATLFAYVKVATRIPFTAESRRPVTYQVSGLPSGMTFDRATGFLSGMPKKAGSYRIKIIATSDGDSEIRNVTLTVAKLPATLRNKAYGVLVDAAGGVCGTVELTVSASAKLAAKFTLRKGRDTASSILESEADGSFNGTSETKRLAVKMEPNGLWHGRYKEFGLLARAVKGVSFTSVAGTYTLNLFAQEGAERAGYGYLTAKIGKTGSVRVKGVMPDSKSLSVSVRPIRTTVHELALSGIQAEALPDLSPYGGNETVFLLPVFVRKAKQTCYALGIVGSSSPKGIRFARFPYSGALQWPLAAEGFPYQKKQTGAFAGKGASVYRGGTLLLENVPLTGSFTFASAPAGCKLKLTPSSGVFTLKFRDGKKTVSVKGAAVTGSGTATGVGKSVKRIYYAVIE
ncbi:MAG: putative Ig domain-containing protein [Kiritimatiellae bacterium]|nr:putative Ig domain-containing protein [Kiritimatiellia bacterium]